MAVCFLGKEEKLIETTIHSLKLLVKLHLGDAMVRIKITQIYSLCSCGVCQKQAQIKLYMNKCKITTVFNVIKKIKELYSTLNFLERREQI